MSDPSHAEQGHAAPPPGSSVLVVDDVAGIRRGLARVLVERGYQVLTAEDGAAALTLMAMHGVDVVLLDMVLPGKSGMEVLREIGERHPSVEVIIMTAHASLDTALEAVRAGAYDYVSKPFSTPDVVLLAVAKAIERRRLVAENRALEHRLGQQEAFGELVGSSPRMRDVYRLALGVATSSSTVLLLGESGTGKELVARAIHQHSHRSGKPFVAVNCGAIPPDLVESELFGHVRGAFSGASTSREGLFEAANGGTLFLDEVGDLPPAVQVKLLRVLQDGEVRRVGANEPRTVEVRVIAATNVDLKSAIAAGKFREDLYYRLHVIVIRLPPLRQRRDDIPLLAHHFLQRFSIKLHKDVRRISVEAMRQLRDQPWKGNVRELENVIEHAVVLAKGDTVFPADLPFNRPSDDDEAHVHKSVPPGATFSVPESWLELPYAEAKDQVLDAFHRVYLTTMLERTGQNLSEAARRAGLDRSNFRRVLKRHGPGGAKEG